MIVCEVYIPDNCILITKSIVKLNVIFHKIRCFMRGEQYRSSQVYGPPGAFCVSKPSHIEHQFLSCRSMSSTPTSSKYFIPDFLIIFLTFVGISPWKILRLVPLFCFSIP